jgi:alkylhydroperoxidase/carboxymuconolactone decarboxylase family protein YurZ
MRATSVALGGDHTWREDDRCAGEENQASDLIALSVVGRDIERRRHGMTDQMSETPILDLLGEMTNASLETSTLDAESLMLVRIAALVAVDAPPASYLLNLGAASEIGVDATQVTGVLAAIAPIVGGPRVVAAAGNIARALGFAMDIVEADLADSE